MDNKQKKKKELEIKRIYIRAIRMNDFRKRECLFKKLKQEVNKIKYL